MKRFKRYMLVFIFSCLTLAIHAQWYSFIENKSDYLELDSSATVGYADYESSYIPLSLPIGFSFKFHDNFYDTLFVNKLLTNALPYYFSNSSSEIISIQSWTYHFKDGTFYNLRPLFPLTYKYKTSGTAGNRIFIFEWKKADFFLSGVYCPPCSIDTSINYFYNIQLRLYERNGDIVIHFGKSYLLSDINSTIYIQKSNLLQTYLSGSVNDVRPEFGVGAGLNNSSMSGWPEDGTVYKFYVNNSNQIFLNDFTSSIIDNDFILQSKGATIGHNFLLDYEWAEKFYVPVPLLIKGMICQNFGTVNSNDSATFSIYSVGTDGLPDKALYQTKRPYNCLKLDESLNYIAFDTITTVIDSFFVAFGFKPYNKLQFDTIGLCFSQVYSNYGLGFPQINNYGRTVARAFNNKWYDLYTMGYLSNYWFTNYTRDNDLIHFALAPVASFDKANDTLIHDSLNCRYFTNSRDLSYNNDEGVLIYPVPAKNTINIKFPLTENSGASLIILNNSGIIIDDYKFPTIQTGNYMKEINVSNYPNGIYIVVIRSQNLTIHGKFIIQK